MPSMEFMSARELEVSAEREVSASGCGGLRDFREVPEAASLLIEREEA